MQASFNESIFEIQCTENYEEMKVILDLILTTRIMYMQIRINYYQHHSDFNTKNKEIHILREVEDFTKDILHIQSQLKQVCNHFFVASSLPLDSPFFKGNYDLKVNLVKYEIIIDMRYSTIKMIILLQYFFK